RSRSFTSTDVDQLVDLRARQRTSKGAFTQTTLGNLGYYLAQPSPTADPSTVSLPSTPALYCILFSLFYMRLAFLRRRHLQHDFADGRDDDIAPLLAIPTVRQEHGQSFWRPFVTVGRIVALVACVAAATELALLALL
ncbi:hypothetical protein EDB83DRAFT_2213653, partial [Lactarius deliciosus]